MYDEVIDTLAFDSIDLVLRIMIPECVNSKEHVKKKLQKIFARKTHAKRLSLPVMMSVISYFVPVCLKQGDF